MTKTDQKYLLKGAFAGLLGGLGIWFFFKRTRTIPEINPALVKWLSP